MQISLSDAIKLDSFNEKEAVLIYSGKVTTNANQPIVAQMVGEIYANDENVSAKSFVSGDDGTFHIVQPVLKERLSDQLELVVRDSENIAKNAVRNVSDLLNDAVLQQQLRSGDESTGEPLDAD